MRRVTILQYCSTSLYEATGKFDLKHGINVWISYTLFALRNVQTIIYRILPIAAHLFVSCKLMRNIEIG